MRITKNISNIYFVIDGYSYRRQFNDKTLSWYYKSYFGDWVYVPELQSIIIENKKVYSHIKLENMYINHKREKKLIRILED